MGGGGKLTAMADPVGYAASKSVGDEAFTVLNPMHALTYNINPIVEEGKAADEAADKRQQETTRQDEIMKRLQLGDNPFLNDTNETLA